MCSPSRPQGLARCKTTELQLSYILEHLEVLSAACCSSRSAWKAFRYTCGGDQAAASWTAATMRSATWLGVLDPERYAAAKSAMQGRRPMLLEAPALGPHSHKKHIQGVVCERMRERLLQGAEGGPVLPTAV